MSPAVVVALALSASLAWSTHTTGPETSAASAASASQDLVSCLNVPAAQGKPADFDLNVPYTCADFDLNAPDSSAELTPQASGDFDPADTELDRTRFYPHSEPEYRDVTLPSSASSSPHFSHPDSFKQPPHDTGPTHIFKRFDSKRKRDASSATESSQRRISGSDIIMERSKQSREPEPTESPSDFDESSAGLNLSRPVFTNAARNKRLGLLLPLLFRLENLDLLQAEAEQHQVDAEGLQRSCKSSIPRLSEKVKHRMELFAAHYLRHFVSRKKARLSGSDFKYRLSLECLLLCYYGHCGGDRAKFDSRFPRWGQCHFTNCNGIHECNYETRVRGHDQGGTVMSAESKTSEHYRGRRVHVHRLIRNIPVSANDYQLAQELETPPWDTCVIPRLQYNVAVPMTVVVAHYTRHFGPDSPPISLPRPDRDYRNSLQCMIVCYYEHFGGVDAAFRERFGDISCATFHQRCIGKMACNADHYSAATQKKKQKTITGAHDREIRTVSN